MSYMWRKQYKLVKMYNEKSILIINDIDTLLEDIHNRLEITFQIGESSNDKTLWYNSITTLLEQCLHEVKLSIDKNSKIQQLLKVND